jgi:hypothetical protein
VEYEDSKDLEGLFIEKKRDIENQKHLQKTKEKDSESADSPVKLSPSPQKIERISMDDKRDSVLKNAVSRFSSIIDDVVGKSPERQTPSSKLIDKLNSMKKDKDNTIKVEVDGDKIEMEALSPFSLAIKKEGSLNKVAPL